ncbi:MAG: beta-lactamase family protein [Myxococcaceae bacterium]|nr:beta-lactamase family protein [Myxococcaceae bacterium]MBH2006943.1 beta-lactamase family protein [Myxococcaceae bacterium]
MHDLETVLENAIAEGFTQKAAALVSCPKGRIELYGGEADRDTLFDLASLTKILCTTVLAAQAVITDRLLLDEEPWSAWPGVRVRDVLAHQAGLPPFVEIAQREDVYQIPLKYPPRTQTVYSDIGFIALGDLLEQRLGRKLDQLLCFPQLHFGGPEPVFDPRCRALGGVAGHAGLFGTLLGVEQRAQFLLGCLHRPHSLLELEIQSFANEPGLRALGFDKPSETGSTIGVLSVRSVGHLGFTGTSVWLDPESQAIYILLLSRLDAGERASDLLSIRQAFHQQAARWVSSS